MKSITNFLVAMALSALLLANPVFAINSDSDATSTKSVLVTGASSGIGRNLAETLAKEGYHVYAGARKDKDLADLNAIENITAVRLDVTKQSEIDAVIKLIEQKGTGLYGLVNNAGIYIGGPVATTAISDHRKLFEVNVEGVYRVTKAFIPLIVKSKGRISTTGSIAGTVTRANMTGYSGSKHWIEAYTDALAAEMAPKGVKVSVIQPGNYQTHIRRSSVLREFAKKNITSENLTPEMKKQLDDMTAYELSLKKPDEVSAAYLHALFDEKPLRRYMVVPKVEEKAYTMSEKMRQLVELNQWGPYPYSRDQLVEMLDKALADKKTD